MTLQPRPDYTHEIPRPGDGRAGGDGWTHAQEIRCTCLEERLIGWIAERTGGDTQLVATGWVPQPFTLQECEVTGIPFIEIKDGDWLVFPIEDRMVFWEGKRIDEVKIMGASLVNTVVCPYCGGGHVLNAVQIWRDHDLSRTVWLAPRQSKAERTQLVN